MVELTLDLLKKRHFVSSESKEACKNCIDELTSIRLDRENLHSLKGLDILGPNVTHLYLQHNCIVDLNPIIKCGLSNLMFLCASFNLIEKVCDISSLKSLLFLDLSNNKINSIDPGCLPKYIQILNLKNNSCGVPSNEELCRYLPHLTKINDRELMPVDVQEQLSDNEEDETNIWTLANDILLRSQERIETLHNEHLHEMDDFINSFW